MQRYIKYLLFFIVILLPFAEWKFIGLPLRGRPILIDLNRYLSVSVFDLAFTFFAVVCLYTTWRNYRRKIFFNWYLLWWVICGILIVILLIQQQPALPYLIVTPVNVIDVRSLMTHFAVAVCVTAAVTQIPFALIIRGAQLFYPLMAIGSAVLCYFALNANVFFQFNYPFNTPSSVAFPFPNQNVAAVFMVLCFIGAIGAICVTVSQKMRGLLVLCAPIFLLAIALTGSRSNMFICCTMIVAYLIIYIVYYRYFALACITNSKPSHPVIVLISICIGVTLIFININWMPVRRSMSLFIDVWANPTTLVMGGKDSARNELWTKAVEKKKFEGNLRTGVVSSETQTFSLGLTSVKDGCKTISNNIDGLKIGKPYYVRLTLTPSGTNTNLAVLNIFEDSRRQQLVGSQETSFNAPRFANIYYFIADTDNRFVIVNAELSDFTKTSGGVTVNSGFQQQTIRLFEEPFNGGSEPCISLKGNNIQINADTRLLRGYVYGMEKNHDIKNTFILEYTVNVKSTKYSMPLDPPVMFYVGLSDHPDMIQKRDDWRLIRNGLLIRHERTTAQLEKDLLLSSLRHQFYWAIMESGEMSYSADQIDVFNREVRCGMEGQNLINRLWEPMIKQDMTSRRLEPVIANEEFYKNLKSEVPKSEVPKSEAPKSEIPKSDIYKIKTTDKNIRSLTSTGPRSEYETWSADYQISLRGSLHNVYLDWYYYVGKIPLIIFLIFIISLLGAFTHFTWKSRFTKEFPLILSILCQLLAIVALMYAHPYIWIKYIWFVFGLATAVMIHPDFKKNINGRFP